jgi:transcriptional regulator with XRE-family HTH domain
MSEDWSELVKRHRLRHGLTQARMAILMGVSQRTISRWERGEDKPSLVLQRQLRDFGWAPPGTLMTSLAQSVRHCPFPRALCRTPKLRLQAVSGPAIRKRPSVSQLIGRDLVPLACGILEEMLDDRTLQKSIASREIACVLATTRGVLTTSDRRRVATFRTVITYFFHEDTLFSDAVSMPAPARAVLGYEAVPMDAIGPD